MSVNVCWAEHDKQSWARAAGCEKRARSLIQIEFMHVNAYVCIRMQTALEGQHRTSMII